MIYVLKNDQGQVTAVSDHAESTNWISCSEEDQELITFLKNNPYSSKEVMKATDADFIRVLEDVIDLLIEKEVIKFTDFPMPVQRKLLKRRRYRKTISQNPDAMTMLDNNSGLL